MSEPLLGSGEEKEDIETSAYSDVYTNDIKPLSNGVLFLVLSTNEWERERMELMKIDRLEGKRYEEDEEEEEHFDEIVMNVVKVCCRSVIRIFRDD